MVSLLEVVSVNVLFEFVTVGTDDIWTQELKLSEDEDTCNFPVHEVFEVLVVKEVVSIALEKVTEILLFIGIEVSLFAGFVDEIVGAIESTKKVFTLNALLAFNAVSVTVMVQFE